MNHFELLSIITENKLYILIGLYVVFFYFGLRRKKGTAIFCGLLATCYINWAFPVEISQYINFANTYYTGLLSSKVSAKVLNTVLGLSILLIRLFPYWCTFLLLSIIHWISNKLRAFSYESERQRQDLMMLQRNATRKKQLALLDKKIRQVRASMATLQGYRIDILPFMEYLNQTEPENKELCQKLPSLRSHAISIQLRCDEINRKAEALGITDRVESPK